MTVLIVLFVIASGTAFGMLAFRAWEIRSGRVVVEMTAKPVPEISFRIIERSVLYSAKHIVQWIVIATIKYWFLAVTKVRKLVSEKWPAIHDRFTKKPVEGPVKPSFITKALLESKTKIKRIKQKIREDHDM